MSKVLERVHLCAVSSETQLALAVCVLHNGLMAFRGMQLVVGVSICIGVLSGCGANSSYKAGDGTTSVGAKAKTALTLRGPGGSVSIGDSPEVAKEAFPAPKGAHTMENSMSLAILGTQGWSWADEGGSKAFEVAFTDGKIIGIVLTDLTKGAVADGAARAVLELGAPTRKAVGKVADALVWENGDHARFVVVLKKPAMILGEGVLTMIGAKKDLAMLNYRADDPGTIVRILDQSANVVAPTGGKKH